MKSIALHIMKNLKMLLCILSMTTAMSCNGDDGVALLSTLFNSRLTVILKGTYATDRPLHRSEINGNRLFIDTDDATSSLIHTADTGCTPYVDPHCLPRYDELPIWIDIGELRLSSRSPLSDLTEITSSDDAEKFWDIVSIERQVYCSTAYSIDFDNGCAQTGGLINFSDFSNGRGAIYPSRDVPSGLFVHSGIFIRSFATGWGLLGNILDLDKFDNRDIVGTESLKLLQYDPDLDDLSIQLLPPQWFPLHHKVVFGQEQTIVLDHGESSVVLEYRFNLLENLMVHSFFNVNSNADHTVVAASDWRRGHDDDATDRGFHMGGNVLARTRMFYPHISNTVYIDGGVESKRHYYALYVASEGAKDEHLPLAATPVRNANDNELKYIMPGEYVIQCRYDCNNDGYPELVLSESGVFPIGNGPAIAGLSHSCGCGIDAATVTTNACAAHAGCY